MPLFPRFGIRFGETIEDLSGKNPLLLRGVEKAVRGYKEDEVAEVEEEGEGGWGDEDTAIWRRIHNSAEWVDAKSRVESYARKFISGKTDEERTW